MINIKHDPQKTYPLGANDVRDGKAYESPDGTIFIGCMYQDIVAVSILGDAVLLSNMGGIYLREVDIDVVVRS